MKFSRIFLLIGSFIVVTCAQTQKPAAPAKETKVTSQGQESTKKLSAPEKQMYGMLVSLDKTKLTFIVKLKGKKYEFQSNPSTKIQGKEGSVAFSDLKSGNAISVTYLKNTDSRTALSIVQNSAISVSPKTTNKNVTTANETKPSIKVPSTVEKSATTDKSDKTNETSDAPSIAVKKSAEPDTNAKVNEKSTKETPKKIFVKVDSIKATTPSVPAVKKENTTIKK